MGTLSALLLATPIFGFALTPPSISLLTNPLLIPEIAEAEEGPAAPPAGETTEGETTEGETTEGETTEGETTEGETTEGEITEGETTETPTPTGEEGGEPTTPEVVEPSLTEPETPPPPPPPVEPPPSPTLTTVEPTLTTTQSDEARVAEAAGSSFDELARQGERRRQLRNAHRGLGIATWLAMAATMTVGAIQFADRYGASEYEDTRCARGTAMLGQANCDQPWIHLFSAITTGSLYFSTFGLSAALSRDNSEELQQQRRTDRRLRMHRTLRWVHLALMAAQIVEGLIFANLDNGALDPVEDHGTLRGLHIFHMVVGVLTFGSLTWAGAMMIGE